MEEIESVEQIQPESDLNLEVKSKFSLFLHWLFGFTKFVLGILLLPVVYAVSVSFLNEFVIVEKQTQNYFWAGILSFLIIHLLVWEPSKIYTRGHKILEFIFRFVRPLVKVAPYLLPIYAIVLFALYSIVSLFTACEGLLNYTVFLLGFSIILHLVFSAKTLRSKKEDFLKGNYIFGFSFVYILNIFLLSLFTSLIFDKFSFVNFTNQTFETAKTVICGAFKQLFL